MSKQIKFRTWSNEQQKFLSGYPIGEELKDGFILCGISEDDNCQETTSDDLILMQFTGLKDKNGKELYSGDLFKDEKGLKYRCYDVVGGFAHSLPQFPSTYKGTSPYPLQPLADEQTIGWFESNCIIFANIYENPELL